MSIPIVIYTHSDYAFVWPAVIGQFEKHTQDIEIHWCYNNTADIELLKTIPSRWIKHTYRDNTIWTDRLFDFLKDINYDYIMFLHEDWIPIKDISSKILKDMESFMKEKSVSFLLSYSHISVTSKQPGIYTGYPDYNFYKEDSHIFQPAIWKRSTLIDFCGLKKSKVQNEDQDCLQFMRSKNCYSVQNTKTATTLRTTNSLFFPHMHVLSEGLWNFTKYPTLEALLQTYNIDTKSRGIHTWWELDSQ